MDSFRRMADTLSKKNVCCQRLLIAAGWWPSCLSIKAGRKKMGLTGGKKALSSQGRPGVGERMGNDGSVRPNHQRIQGRERPKGTFGQSFLAGREGRNGFRTMSV